MTASTFTDSLASSTDRSRQRYNLFLLLVAGLGGLLYGIDVGIIGGALPYLEATSRLSPAQLSIIVAAVLLGSVFSTLFAGLLADWMGRKPLMILSGVAFIVSIPVIALSQGYAPLFFGRLLQGMSGGFIGIVVPFYLAECLSASTRGKGTGVFQWLLTFGIVAAALVGIYFSYRVDAVARTRRSSSASCLQEHGLAQHLLGLASTRRALRHRQLHGHRIAPLALSPQTRLSRPAPHSFAPARPNRQPLSCRRWNPHPKPAQTSGEKVRDSLLRRKYVSSVPAGLRHPGLQHGHRHQLHHRLQHRTSSCRAASPTFNRTGDTCSSPWSTSASLRSA